jgi:hypothetical protein
VERLPARESGPDALGELRRPAARREEAKVADPDEALGQNVDHEAAEKLVDIERERSTRAGPVIGAAHPDVAVWRTDASVLTWLEGL